MYSPFWKQVDFGTHTGQLARSVLLEVAPDFCSKANADVLECLRSTKNAEFELMVLKLQFTELVFNQLDPSKLLEYDQAMITQFKSKDKYPSAVQVVKWWQLGLYCGARSMRDVQQPLKTYSIRRTNVSVRDVLDSATQTDEILTIPDAAKKLAELFPSLRTQRIEGLDSLIDNLLEATSTLFADHFRVADYLLQRVPLWEVKKFNQLMQIRTGRSEEYPDLIAVILSAQYPLCMDELMEEHVGKTPLLRLRFRYGDYL